MGRGWLLAWGQWLAGDALLGAGHDRGFGMFFLQFALVFFELASIWILVEHLFDLFDVGIRRSL